MEGLDGRSYIPYLEEDIYFVLLIQYPRTHKLQNSLNTAKLESKNKIKHKIKYSCANFDSNIGHSLINECRKLIKNC